MEIDEGDEAHGDDDFEDEGRCRTPMSAQRVVAVAAAAAAAAAAAMGCAMGGGSRWPCRTLQREPFELTDATRNARGVEVASDRVVRSKGLNPDDLQVVELLGRGAGSSVVERIDRRTGCN